jgi:hypothetical protein
MITRLWTTLGGGYFRKIQFARTQNGLISAKYFYAQRVNHPIIQKIIDGGLQTNIDSMLGEIGGLSDDNKEKALKLVLSYMRSSIIPPSTAIHPEFINHAQKNP